MFADQVDLKHLPVNICTSSRQPDNLVLCKLMYKWVYSRSSRCVDGAVASKFGFDPVDFRTGANGSVDYSEAPVSQVQTPRRPHDSERSKSSRSKSVGVVFSNRLRIPYEKDGRSKTSDSAGAPDFSSVC